MSKTGWTWTVIAAVVLGAVGVSMYSGEGGWLKERLLALHGVHGKSAHRDRPAEKSPETAREATIPFELVRGHVVVNVTVDGSRPLSFLLDTGSKFTIVDLERAKELGLALGAEVHVKGVGPRETMGAFLESGKLAVPGLPGYSQPVSLAIPLAGVAARIGHPVDGILGGEFIREFVVELDYPSHALRLHDKDAFAYTGSGESVALHMDAAGHPLIAAEVTPVGGEPIRAQLKLDIGSDAALGLNTPFVVAHHLPPPGTKTIRGLGRAGTGGKASGSTGRVAALKIGSYTLHEPVAFFAEDTAGAFASTDFDGSLGQEVLGRFKLYLDYAHDRIILEPSSTFAEAFDRAYSGLTLEAEGPDYRTFRITEVLDASPASEAGLEVDDVITFIDGKGAGESSLTRLLEDLQRPVARKLSVRRGAEDAVVSLTPRALF